MTTVATQHISKSFGTQQVLRDITLSIEEGDVFYLLGPSGCGKTTLLRIIAGFDSPDSGVVSFDNADVTSSAPAARGVGFVFQQYALWPHMTVGENVGFGLEMRRIRGKERTARIDEALEQVRLSGLAGRYPHQLSGGQQQRVALARALAIRPRVLLLDEPLSNLDARLRDEIREELRSLFDRIDATVICVTHDQHEALSMADRIAVMNRGVLEQVGTPREIFDSPLTPFVGGLVGPLSQMRGVVHFDGPSAGWVDLGEGSKIPVTKVPEGVRSGDAVIAAFRPSDPEVIARTDSAKGDFVGTVSRSVFLGDSLRITLSIGKGDAIEISCDSSRALKEGDSIGLRIPPARVLVFSDKQR